jgi:transglutaminase-like putative cysteine protease
LRWEGKLNARLRELEPLLLAMFAAVPLYATQAISIAPLLVFHALMIGVAARVLRGKSPELIPPAVMRGLGIAYVVFYLIDAAVISRSAIAASTHLVLFIAFYQAIESGARNLAQRVLTASLIFIASIATATHIAILPFVIVYTFMLFRQLMRLSHVESAAAARARVADPPANRAAAFYVAGTAVIGLLLFPILPRVRNPLVPGIAGALKNSSTGLSDTIDFGEQRTITPDSSVVARVWMGPETIPFFTPLRLRGAIYDRIFGDKWVQTRGEFRALEARGNATPIANPEGFTRRASVQQRFPVGTRLLLPIGTYEVIGIGPLYEGPVRDIISTWQRREPATYDVRMARDITPLHVRRGVLSNYRVTPEVTAMARRIVGAESDPMRQAAAIERYLSTRFRYIPDPSQIGRAMSVDRFLLTEHRGHCEYFAAGMVALMTSLGTPARIVGGFYGGKLNPLTGYFVVQLQDAHAWVEVYDGTGWKTFDPTPADLRPGNQRSGLLRTYASALGDSVNYFWDRYILTFGLGDQIALAAEAIARARGALAALERAKRRTNREAFNPRYAATMVGVVAIGLALIWYTRRSRRPGDLLIEHLARLGIEVGPAMTMAEALAELQRTHPQAAADLEPLVKLYEEERFSARPDRSRVAAIRTRLSDLRV